MSLIVVNLNYLGIPLDRKRMDLLLSKKTDQILEVQRAILDKFFGLPVKHLPIDVLERYCEVSGPDLYTPILPVSDKLFERLLSPLRSAKKCFCLGEYLAAIELAAHLAEMLAQLTWQITPILQGGARITPEFEKGLWGRSFEELGQEQRVRVLKAFSAISDGQFDLFNRIRKNRNKCFHRWTFSMENIETLSLNCFKDASELVKETLQIELSDSERGTIKINPLLADYLKGASQSEPGK